MSRDGSIELTFLDGEEYIFRLAWGQLIKLQESRGCGPFVVLERLHGSTWMVEDISEVVRLGLIGGGVDEIKARKLVKEHVLKATPMKSLAMARDIIAAAVVPPAEEEEDAAKKAAAPNGSTTSPTDASVSAPSTGSAH